MTATRDPHAGGEPGGAWHGLFAAPGAPGVEGRPDLTPAHGPAGRLRRARQAVWCGHLLGVLAPGALTVAAGAAASGQGDGTSSFGWAALALVLLAWAAQAAALFRLRALRCGLQASRGAAGRARADQVTARVCGVIVLAAAWTAEAGVAWQARTVAAVPGAPLSGLAAGLAAAAAVVAFTAGITGLAAWLSFRSGQAARRDLAILASAVVPPPGQQPVLSPAQAGALRRTRRRFTRIAVLGAVLMAGSAAFAAALAVHGSLTASALVRLAVAFAVALSWTVPCLRVCRRLAAAERALARAVPPPGPAGRRPA